jgi:triosephosphate isomerase
MQRKPLVAGNWKMNKATGEAVRLAQDISDRYYKDYDQVDTVLCPPFISLKSVRSVLEFDRSRIRLGAQDVFWEPDGAYTGAISTGMLREVGCGYCIVGHSERRQFFAETDGMVNRKARALLDADITPIVCVGEGLEVREAGAKAAADFVTAQVVAALQQFGPEDIGRTVIAYEPIWAIGTGRTATPESAQEICAAIREQLAALSDHRAASAVRVLYGGSMKPENAALFAPLPDVDGGLIGGAALQAADFIEIVKAFV